MKNLLKGALMLGTALVAGYVVYKKVKEEKEHEIENNEEVNIDVKQENENNEEVNIDVKQEELTQEQQELYQAVVNSVRQQMKPYMRRRKVYRLLQCILMFIMANCVSVIAITYDMERLDKIKHGGDIYATI